MLCPFPSKETWNSVFSNLCLFKGFISTSYLQHKLSLALNSQSSLSYVVASFLQTTIISNKHHFKYFHFGSHALVKTNSHHHLHISKKTRQTHNISNPTSKFLLHPSSRTSHCRKRTIFLMISYLEPEVELISPTPVLVSMCNIHLNIFRFVFKFSKFRYIIIQIQATIRVVCIYIYIYIYIYILIFYRFILKLWELEMIDLSQYFE
jgi:hypothetical protein